MTSQHGTLLPKNRAMAYSSPMEGKQVFLFPLKAPGSDSSKFIHELIKLDGLPRTHFDGGVVMVGSQHPFML